MHVVGISYGARVAYDDIKVLRDLTSVFGSFGRGALMISKRKGPFGALKFCMILPCAIVASVRHITFRPPR
jgi:hypothetical protein